MARFAIMAELPTGMVRRLSPLESLTMAGVTIRRRPHEPPPHMASRATDRPMRPRQWELRLRMVESRLIPANRVVTGHAVVAVVARRVTRIANLLVFHHVAVPTSRRRAGELAINMTLRAFHVPVRAGQWEGGQVVIQRSRRPSRRRMADRAFVVHLMLDVIRVPRRFELRPMASEAVGGSSVIPGLVALHTIGRPVRAGQGEVRVVVVDRSRFPSVLRVTNRAIVVVVAAHVIRIADALEVCQVAGVTVGGRSVEPGCVALVARQRPVSPLQREAGLIVVDGGRFPAVGGVTGSAVVVVVAADMVGVADGLESVGVAIEASLWRAGPTPADVTGRAINLLMLAGQLEPADVVIEGRWTPTGGGMTGRARLRKVGGRVIRVGRAIVVRHVARLAGGRGVGVSGRVTDGASPPAMPGGQGERGRVGVSGVLPSCDGERVAAEAIHAETGLAVVRVGGRVERSYMAAGAVQWRVNVASVAVAGLTINASMDAGQGEARLIVTGGHLGAVFPAGGGVASRALVAELVVVDVAMAAGAEGGGFLEFQGGMAIGATDALVTAFEWEGGLGRVVEGQNAAGDLPTVGAVAGVAGDVHRAVGAALHALGRKGGG